MIFVTDDHRTIRLAHRNNDARGVVPELDESLMKSLMDETREPVKSAVKVAIDRCVPTTVKKF